MIQFIDFIYQNESPIRLVAFLSGFTILAFWEWATPKRALSQIKLNRWLSNFSLTVCGTFVVRIIIPTAAIGVAYLVEKQHLGFANQFDIPFWIKVIVTFILLDLVIYFQHVMFHVLPVLWRFHRVHHSDLDFDVTTGLRFHPLEILLSIVIKLVAIVALGAPVLAVILFEVILNLMSMFSHSNIYLNKTFERVLRWFIVTPDMHRVHHSVLENETNSNFAFNISLWDRIFATYLAKPREGQNGMTIGLDEFRESKWQGLKGLIIMPFATGIRGYAINFRDTINTDAFSLVNMLVDEQTKSLKQAKEIAEQSNKELQTTVYRLTESENYQSLLIKNMIDGFISIDQKGIIESFNPAAENIFGYKENEVIGENVRKLMSQSEAIQHDNHLARYKEKDAHHIIGISRDVQGQRKDGSTFPMDIALNDVNIRGKQIFTAVIRDISERKEAEAKIIASKDKAEKANRVKTEFLNSMSHELRTPLNAIIGFSELLSLQKSIDPMLQVQVTHIRQAGSNLLAQVENILNLNQIEEGKVNVVLETFSLSTLLDECSTLIKPLSERFGTQLKFKENCYLNEIQADRNLLKQVLLNLLSNAVRYTKAGGEVLLSTDEYNEEGLKIIVKDNGPGIDKIRLDNLFEPFNRLGLEGSNISGVGIGLLISKKLTELMGGTLGVKSVLGEGSQFWISLPHARSSAES